MSRFEEFMRTETDDEHRFLVSDEEVAIYGLPINPNRKKALLAKVHKLGSGAHKGADMAIAISDLMHHDRFHKKALWVPEEVEASGLQRQYNRPFSFDRGVSASWLGFVEVLPRVASAGNIARAKVDFDGILETQDPIEILVNSSFSVLGSSISQSIERGRIPAVNPDASDDANTEAYTNPQNSIGLFVVHRSQVADFV